MDRLLVSKISDHESSFQLLKQQIRLSLVCRKRMCPSKMLKILQDSECGFGSIIVAAVKTIQSRFNTLPNIHCFFLLPVLFISFERDQAHRHSIANLFDCINSATMLPALHYTVYLLGLRDGGLSKLSSKIFAYLFLFRLREHNSIRHSSDEKEANTVRELFWSSLIYLIRLLTGALIQDQASYILKLMEMHPYALKTSLMPSKDYNDRNAKIV
uniref:Uncharacterized protein n=1 Tax=Glossina palpalis gambiensis TaxID=67801 RepID=A0A1B0BGQ9_9MUSC